MSAANPHLFIDALIMVQEAIGALRSMQRNANSYDTNIRYPTFTVSLL
jgi:hypothetical protein